MPGESDSDTRVSGTQSLATKGLIQVSFPVSYNKVSGIRKPAVKKLSDLNESS